MRRRSQFQVSLPFISVVLSWNLIAHAGQQADERATILPVPKSDCEKAGFHGPVRSVVEERTYAGSNGSDGQSIPPMKAWNQIEYDRNGRIAVTHWRGSSRDKGMDSSDSISTYRYNDAGQLLRIAQEQNGNLIGETIYSYDGKGRLQNILDSRDPGNPIAFHYDASGRKTKIAIVPPPKDLSGTIVAASSDYFFATEGKPVNLPGGGTATTSYDERDRPTEIETRNANGEVVYRTSRTYDDGGHVLAEKQRMDDPLSLFPPADQKKIADTGKASLQDLRDEITKFIGSSEIESVSYVYDAQGRQTQMIRTGLGHIGERIDIAYNEQGDVVKETTQSVITGTPNSENDMNEISERIYSYEYDSYGNWIVKKASWRSLPDGTFKDSGDEIRRTIEYY